MNKKLTRILAVNDLSGWGHTSLMAVIPIMYRMGIQTGALPTAVLSTNTDYPGYVLSDQLDQMRRSLEHWRSIGIRYNSIYSGFLGSPAQTSLLLPYLETLLAPEGMILVDPVMGDVGGLYSCYDQSIIPAMRELIARADVITPNLYEASTLLGKTFDPDITGEGTFDLCRGLQELGAKNVIITSVPASGKDSCAVAVLDAQGDFEILEGERIDAWYPGTGDVFTSLLCASMLRKVSIFASVRFAMKAVAEGIRISLERDQDHRDGMHLEILLNSAIFSGLLKELIGSEL